MCEHALTTYGRLDVLFNNAGVGGAIGPLTETTVEDWDYTLDVLARCLSGYKTRRKNHASPGNWRLHHQYRLGCGSQWRCRSAGLSPSGQSCGDQPVEIFGGGIGARPHSGKCHLSRYIATPLTHTGDLKRFICLREKSALARLWSQRTHCRRGVISGIRRFRFVTGEAIVVDGGLTAGLGGRADFLGMTPRAIRVTPVSQGLNRRWERPAQARHRHK